jgi:hypothetical protein
MKRVAIRICLALAIVATANLFLGRAQEAGMRQRQPPSNGATASNPLKVALLKWYAANQSTPYDGVLFEVGNLPYGVAGGWPTFTFVKVGTHAARIGVLIFASPAD